VHDTAPVPVHSRTRRPREVPDQTWTGYPAVVPPPGGQHGKVPALSGGDFAGPCTGVDDGMTAPRVPQQVAEWSDRRVSTGRYLARGLRGLLETLIPAIIIALLINLFVAQATRVFGLSMEPNLHTEQRLVVEKISYNSWLHLRSPQRGDVVVLHAKSTDELLIKRVIGLPGDRIEVRNGHVFINRVPLDEPYIVLPANGDYGPVDVPPLQLFVMGDNRNYSNDSRTFGPVPMQDIVGRAWFSYWPPEAWGPVQ
jgi:signal peptidase I